MAVLPIPPLSDATAISIRHSAGKCCLLLSAGTPGEPACPARIARDRSRRSAEPLRTPPFFLILPRSSRFLWQASETVPIPFLTREANRTEGPMQKYPISRLSRRILKYSHDPPAAPRPLVLPASQRFPASNLPLLVSNGTAFSFRI